MKTVKIRKGKLISALFLSLVLVFVVPSFSFRSEAATIDFQLVNNAVSFNSTYLLDNYEYVHEVSVPFYIINSDSGIYRLVFIVDFSSCSFSDSSIVSWVDNAQLHFNGQNFSGSFINNGYYIFRSDISFEFAEYAEGTITADVHYIYSTASTSYKQASSQISSGTDYFYSPAGQGLDLSGYFDFIPVAYEAYEYASRTYINPISGSSHININANYVDIENPLYGASVSTSSKYITNGDITHSYHAPSLYSGAVSLQFTFQAFKSLSTVGVTAGEKQIADAVLQGNQLQQQQNTLQEQQNQLQNQTNNLLTNFDGKSAFDSSNDNLNTSIGNYESVESSIFDTASSSLSKIKFADYLHPSTGTLGAIQFLSSFISGIILSMGEFSSLYTVGFVLVIVSIAFGSIKYVVSNNDKGG